MRIMNSIDSLFFYNSLPSFSPFSFAQPITMIEPPRMLYQLLIYSPATPCVFPAQSHSNPPRHCAGNGAIAPVHENFAMATTCAYFIDFFPSISFFFSFFFFDDESTTATNVNRTCLLTISPALGGWVGGWVGLALVQTVYIARTALFSLDFSILHPSTFDNSFSPPSVLSLADANACSMQVAVGAQLLCWR